MITKVKKKMHKLIVLPHRYTFCAMYWACNGIKVLKHFNLFVTMKIRTKTNNELHFNMEKV